MELGVCWMRERAEAGSGVHCGVRGWVELAWDMLRLMIAEAADGGNGGTDGVRPAGSLHLILERR